MNMTNEDKKEQKDRLWSGLSSVMSIALIIVLLLTFGLKSQIPPPPPKKTFYVELDAEVGGGGGGGMDAPSPNKVTNTAAPNYATQNVQQAPSVAHSDKTSTTTQQAQPKVDQSAMFKGGKGGSGSGGGKGDGIGSGTGMGNGPGEGDGSGGRYGQGTGYRGMTSRPSLEIKEDHGTVCVEVFIEEDGTVSKAVLVPAKSSITNSSIQRACLQKAKQIKYDKGKRERRYVVFGTEN